MKKLFPVAMFTVAVLALPTGSWGQTVYRCGSSYSQTPCAGGVMTDIRDNNTPEPQVAKERAARKAANLRAIKREHLLHQEDTVARAEHRLYIRGATKAAAVQARAEADARKKSEQASKRAAKP